jgi:L-lactate dehydrogenase complex protein LldG
MVTEQTTNNQARREILRAVRDHLAASASADAVYAEHEHGVKMPASRVAVALPPAQGSATERFRQALEGVAGHCITVANEKDAATALQQIIEHHNAQSIAVSDASLVRRVLTGVATSVTLLENCVPPALFDCDLGITSAQGAVAETGTLVLESEAERHRLVSLVPPIHVAIIEASQIRDTLGEVLQSIGGLGKDEMSRTVTFTTGPSRTSDIELTLAIGVHGPGELYVIVIQGDHID